MVSSLLEPTPDNLAGAASVNLDVDEPGASALVSRMEEYALTYMSVANISHDENYLPLYTADSSDFSIHTQSKAMAMTVNKVCQHQQSNS